MKKLLEEAKKRYPVGCKFKTIIYGNIYISKGSIRQQMNSENNISMFVEENSFDNISASCYYNGQWAEIIELPKEVNKELIIEIW